MAIASGTCVSFCNQPKAHFGFPWVRPWDNRGKFTWMKRGFNACQTHRSMYPSVFNRFPVIQPVISKVRHLSIFFAHFGLRGKCCMDGKRIQCWSNASQHVPIYLQPFSLRAVARYWSEIATFSYPLYLTPPSGVISLDDLCDFW